MTPLEAIGIAVLSGVASALVTAWASVHVVSLRQGYEDRIRFIDLRRERYSELLREADQHVRILRRQLGVVEEWFTAGSTKNDSPPPLPTTDPISHLAAEIGLLGRKAEVGEAANAMYEALVGLDQFAWDSDIADAGAWLARIDKPFWKALAAYDEARTRFVAAARDDLGRR